jgi:hypothetical protein
MSKAHLEAEEIKIKTNTVRVHHHTCTCKAYSRRVSNNNTTTFENTDVYISKYIFMYPAVFTSTVCTCILHCTFRLILSFPGIPVPGTVVEYSSKNKFQVSGFNLMYICLYSRHYQVYRCTTSVSPPVYLFTYMYLYVKLHVYPGTCMIQRKKI